MERLVVLVAREVVTQQDVMDAFQISGSSTSDEGQALPLREARARFERQYILERLSANQGNLGRTARDLGIERTNLYRKMKQLGIAAPAEGTAARLVPERYPVARGRHVAGSITCCCEVAALRLQDVRPSRHQHPV